MNPNIHLKRLSLTLALAVQFLLAPSICCADTIPVTFMSGDPVVSGSNGGITYNATTGDFNATLSGSSLDYAAPFVLPRGFSLFSGSLIVDLTVDHNGNFLASGTGLTVTGSVTINGALFQARCSPEPSPPSGLSRRGRLRSPSMATTLSPEGFSPRPRPALQAPFSAVSPSARPAASFSTPKTSRAEPWATLQRVFPRAVTNQRWECLQRRCRSRAHLFWCSPASRRWSGIGDGRSGGPSRRRDSISSPHGGRCQCGAAANRRKRIFLLWSKRRHFYLG